MKSSVEDTVWGELEPFVNQLITECRMKQYAAKDNGADPVVRYSYEDLLELTGHSFRSEGDGRGAMYDHRDRLAWDEHLFFDCIHGRGMRFTTDQMIGLKWYCDLADKVLRAYLRRRRELAKAAEHHTNGKNEHLREAIAAIAEQAERDHAIFIRKAREIRHIYDDLQREGDIAKLSDHGEFGDHEVPDGKEALECGECGDVWVREMKRGRKPRTCPECSGR